MTCNAIATATASVAVADQVSQLLGAHTPAGAALIQTVMIKALASLGMKGQAERGINPMVYSLDPYCYVNLKDNKVTVTFRGNRDYSELMAKITATVSQYLTAAAGLMLQAKVKAAVAARGQVYGESRAADGSVIMTVEF